MARHPNIPNAGKLVSKKIKEEHFQRQAETNLAKFRKQLKQDWRVT